MPWLPNTGTGYVTNVFVNGAQLAGYIDWSTLRIRDSGNQQIGQCWFTVTDIGMTANALKDEAFVFIRDATGPLFKGFVRSRAPRVAAIGRVVDVMCEGIESLLDTTLVVSNRRPPSGDTPVESDKARIQYLLAVYGGQGLFNNSFGSTDVSKIRTLRASMPTQHFKDLTLRQAIEEVLGQASETADYYIDNHGRLHTFDASNPENVNAPYVVRVGNPGAGEVAPEELLIDFDTTGLVNDYEVRAKVPSAHVRVISEDSIRRYGRRAAYVDAPDADTVEKARAVGNAALRDNAQRKGRGSFVVKSPYDKNGNQRWQCGDMVTLHSAQHGVSGVPERITEIEWEYLSGDGARSARISFGGDRLRLRGRGSTNVVGASVQGAIG